MADAPVPGLMGRVSGTTGPGLVGEVIVRVRGGAEHFLARPLLASTDHGGQAPRGGALLDGQPRKVPVDDR
ncbi:hypothetical protein ACPCBX_08795 [Streptomyces tuirus]|uniref:Uncharacterized protein n=1 Tax=Streptomyces tuirus TaxID=68278 RepID=A0A7G1N7D3_9ACTN|nr:hypothetical protein [Streptomyces tuirus]BCL18779.1 hypothetical protein GCM10017668_06220 [Streptomyces tuirus]